LITRKLHVIALPLIIAAAFISAGEKAKQIPPPGIDVPAADRTELEASAKELAAAITKLRADLSGKPKLLDLLPDVEIYYRGAHTALTYNEILDAKEIPAAKAQLKRGLERAAQLAKGEAPWATQTGLVVRGYVSKIDGSVQPIGLVVPTDYKAGDTPRRLDFWLHGRGENLTELNFIRDREKGMGEFAPAGAFVLHLYGRFCNANHFAGEVDLFEALERVKAQYPIDENRLVVRGFSMGGAACWHFVAHHAGVFAAANPGAGFAETPIYAKLLDKNVPPYEQKLWHMYNATDYAVNLFNCPTVAYSGEIDKQKQAADIMAAMMKEEGLELTHIIGPKTEHKYEPGAKKEVASRIDELAKKGRDPAPKKIRFTTWTLRYNQMKWVTVDGMGKHWERARVDAELGEGGVKVTTVNVTGLTLHLPAGIAAPGKIEIDGQTVKSPGPLGDKSWLAKLVKNGKDWELGGSDHEAGAGRPRSITKRHGLQGPIDDAFMDSFIMVRPTGKSLNEKSGAWIAGEMKQAISDWRKFFRGEARVMDDSAITEKEIAASNLVLWGDPSSNAILAKIADKLPIKWDAAGVHARGKDYSGDSHVPMLIYPNPLNPKKYVVLNSGTTFMVNAAGSNSRHVSLLPDWAVVDIAATADSCVKDADFFDERWEMTK
jgi:hypothetical protein